MDSAITEVYGNKVRFRVCGVCWSGSKLLMINHAKLNNGNFWAPPGGGIEFGQSIEENLKREFMEETGLKVNTGAFLFGCEFIRPPLHAIELFYEVIPYGGTLHAGSDPELQIIKDVRYMDVFGLNDLNANELHGIFDIARSHEQFRSLKGFYRI